MGGEGRSESHPIRNLAPPSAFLLHLGGELDTETVGELLPPEGGTGSRVKNSFREGGCCLTPALRTRWEEGTQRLSQARPPTPRRPARPSASHPHSGPQEFEVIAQIKLLQSACNSYSIAPEEHFGAWFRAVQRRNEAER